MYIYFILCPYCLWPWARIRVVDNDLERARLNNEVMSRMVQGHRRAAAQFEEKTRAVNIANKHIDKIKLYNADLDYGTGPRFPDFGGGKRGKEGKSGADGKGKQGGGNKCL